MSGKDNVRDKDEDIKITCAKLEKQTKREGFPFVSLTPKLQRPSQLRSTGERIDTLPRGDRPER